MNQFKEIQKRQGEISAHKKQDERQHIKRMIKQLSDYVIAAHCDQIDIKLTNHEFKINSMNLENSIIDASIRSKQNIEQSKKMTSKLQEMF